MSKNENNRNEIAATFFSILCGLAVLLLTGFVTMGGRNADKEHRESKTGAGLLSRGSSKSLTENGNLALSANGTEIAGGDLDLAREEEANRNVLQAKAELHSIESKLNELKAEYDTFESGEPGNSLKVDLDSANLKIGDLEAKASGLAEKWEVSNKENLDLKNKVTDLTQKLSALTTGNKNKADGQSDLLDAQRMKAQEAVAKAAILQGNLDSANSKIRSLESDLLVAQSGDKLKAAVSGAGFNLPFLLNDPSKLDKSMQPLFIKLRGINEDDADSRSKTYAALKEGNATNVMTVNFASGSSKVGDSDRASLSKLISDDSSKYLIVGYASIEGNPTKNAELSSKRSSEVAKSIAGERKGEDRIQAVYFGQTDRFDKKDYGPNRIVEVWKIEE